MLDLGCHAWCVSCPIGVPDAWLYCQMPLKCQMPDCSARCNLLSRLEYCAWSCKCTVVKMQQMFCLNLSQSLFLLRTWQVWPVANCLKRCIPMKCTCCWCSIWVHAQNEGLRQRIRQSLNWQVRSSLLTDVHPVWCTEYYILVFQVCFVK